MDEKLTPLEAAAWKLYQRDTMGLPKLALRDFWHELGPHTRAFYLEQAGALL